MKAFSMMAAVLMLAGCDRPSSETGQRNFDAIEAGKIGSGRTATVVMFVTDRATGCQYIAAGWDDLPMTPRLNAKGKPMGCREDAA